MFFISKDYAASKRSRGRVRKRRKVRKVIHKKGIKKEKAIGKQMISSDAEAQKKTNNKLRSVNVNAKIDTVGSKLNNQVKINVGYNVKNRILTYQN